MSHTRRLASDRRGSAAVEFGVISGALLILTLGAIEAGLLVWTMSVLQTTAELTARCVALSSSACPSGASYAVTRAQQGLFNGSITSSEVTIASTSTCNGVGGTYVKVAITAHHWAATGLITALSRSALTTTACFPVLP